MWISCCLALLLAGCQPGSREDQAKAVDFTVPPASPWLDAAAQISMAVRLTTKPGIDLRRALFATAGSANERQAVVQLRDYTERKDDAPDPQLVYLLDLDQETLAQVEGLPGQVVGLFPAVEGEGWLVAALAAGEGETWDSGKLSLVSLSPAATTTTWGTQARLWPLGVLHEQGVAALPIERFGLAGGLPVPVLMWREKMQRLDTKAQTAKPQAGPWLFLGAAGLAAGLQLDYDPALPAQARITYFAAPGANTLRQRQWTFGYRTSSGQANWLPPLAEVDGATLAAIVYQPDSVADGKGDVASGIYRLLSFNAETGQTSMIEDHLPADLPVVADHGVVFYTRQAWNGLEMRWEAWASSPDGLRKHLLYSTADAIYLAVEDAAAGRRLLLNRQYLVVQQGQPELHSELRELSLDPLVDPGQASDETEPLISPEAAGSKAAPSGGENLFEKPGASKDQHAGSDNPPPSSGGDGPPPIAIPN
jgi:hypothetical protein